MRNDQVMLIAHGGARPAVDPSAYVAPDAVPGQHDELWAVQEPPDFPGTVYGLARGATARERMIKQSEWFGAHRDDEVL